MWPVIVVIDEVFEQFVGEAIEVVEGSALDDVFVEGPPKALDLAVGLRPVRPGVTVDDAEFEQHGLERMLLRIVAGGKLGAANESHVVRDCGSSIPTTAAANPLTFSPRNASQKVTLGTARGKAK